MLYRETITVLSEALDENGNYSGQPELPGLVRGYTVAASRLIPNDPDGRKEFLVRVRSLRGDETSLRNGLETWRATEDEFKTELPTLWTAFGMDEYTTTVTHDDGTTEQVTVTPRIPVFL